MKALFLFHIRVGVRIAVRSLIPLFAALVLLIMIHMNPAAIVTKLALNIFAPQPSARSFLPVAALAFLFSLWAVPRLAMGLNGWMRHLGFSRHDNRRGLLLSLAMVQIPLLFSLVILGVVAFLNGYNIWHATPRLCLLLVSATYCSLPVYRRPLVVLCALSAAACVLSKQWIVVAAGFPLLFVADLVSGTIRDDRKQKTWSSAESLFEFKIAWRALGRKLPIQYIQPLLMLGITALFAYNSQLSGPLLAATARFGGCMAVALFLASLAAKLGGLRPAWPWARSFPVSSYRRIGSDALFLGLHAIPLLIPVAFIALSAMWLVLFTLPLVSVRAAEHIRKFRERSDGSADIVIRRSGIYLESFGIAALLALLPWTAAVWVAATIPAFFSARNVDIRQKVSLWLERHYRATGDPLNWSNR